MDDPARALTDAFVEAFGPYVRHRLGQLGIQAPDGFASVLDAASTRLQGSLEALLSQPYDTQTRGPLELFQEAMEGPTSALEASGAAPASRDEVARAALPGDIFDLAPASSRALGEDAWRAHLLWGAAKANAMRPESGS